MYEVFWKFEDIDEVVIPSTRDIRGQRYGFIRFFEVKDARLLATKLDNIFIENKKLFFNLPRFIKKIYSQDLREYNIRKVKIEGNVIVKQELDPREKAVTQV